MAGNVVVSTGRNGLVAEKADGSGRVDLYSGAPGTIVRGAAIDGATVFFLLANAAPAGCSACRSTARRRRPW